MGQFSTLTDRQRSEQLIPFEHFLERYQVSPAVLWDWSAALKLEPLEENGKVYFTIGNLRRLDQFIQRIEIAWGCQHILAICCRTDETPNHPARSPI